MSKSIIVDAKFIILDTKFIDFNANGHRVAPPQPRPTAIIRDRSIKLRHVLHNAYIIHISNMIDLSIARRVCTKSEFDIIAPGSRMHPNRHQSPAFMHRSSVLPQIPSMLDESSSLWCKQLVTFSSSGFQ